MTTLINGIGYIRVSSDEQVKGTSLEMQEEKLRACARNEGVNIVMIFRDEGESAKTKDREGLLNALNFCQDKANDIQAFLVYKVDRLARNTEDHFFVRSLLSKHKIRLISATENIGDSPHDKLMELMLAGFAEFDNAIRKQRCSAGMHSRLKQGIWPWKPPAGYICEHHKKKDEKKNVPDQPHPQVFPLMQRVMRGYAIGTFNQIEMVQELERGNFYALTGIKPTSKYISDILNGNSTLKFYAGILRNPWAKELDLSDLEYEGKHQPMITGKEYRMIKERLAGNKSLIKKEYRINPDFPLTGTMLCCECGQKVTHSKHQKPNGKEYFHYICYTVGCPMKGKGLATARAEEKFAEKLKEVQLTPQFFQYFREVLLDVWTTRKYRMEGTATVNAQKLKTLEEQKSKVAEAFEQGIYDREMYKERIQKIENEIAVHRINKSEANIDRYDLEANINHAQHLMTSLDALWIAFSPEYKKKFQQLIFPVGITYDRKTTFGTAEMSLIFKTKDMISEVDFTSKSDLVVFV